MTKSKRQHLDEKIDSLDDSTRGQERVAAPGDKSKKKKKRKQKSKKNKRKKDNTDDSSSLPVTKKIKVADEIKDESSSDLPPDSLSEVPLEGSMIGGTMVLINRKEGKVYSALERLENGNLKEIGIVSKKDGSVILYKSEINGKCILIHILFSCFQGKVACIEAGLDATPSSVIGQISC